MTDLLYEQYLKDTLYKVGEVGKVTSQRMPDINDKTDSELEGIIFGYWYEMNVMDTYSGSGQMNFYYNCIDRWIELIGIDAVNTKFEEWHSKRKEMQKEFELSISGKEQVEFT